MKGQVKKKKKFQRKHGKNLIDIFKKKRERFTTIQEKYKNSEENLRKFAQSKWIGNIWE